MSPSRERTTTLHKLSSHSVGTILKNRREQLEFRLDKVARDTKIRKEYLEYIEAGNYERLPDDIYSRGYIKNYADYLGLETAPILLLYKKERSSINRNLKLRDSKKDRKIGLTPIDNPRFIITPRSFVILCVVSLAVLVVGYMIWQFAGLAAAPTLKLDNPNQESVTAPVAFISGRVNGGSNVYINDSPILTNGSGEFREKIALVNGYNQIRVSAKNHLGKTAYVTKVYIANLPKVNAPPMATDKVDGVQLTIKLGDTATWVIVAADGVEIYRGTMLAGATQSFQAANKLTISVGNAGDVSAKLTNNQTVDKDIGTLGSVGQVRRDLEFNKDTQTL